jgi:hypothetical protein
VPEWLFDLDSPGQFMRRIKTVSLSIPCVVGPYTGIHCKLSLLRSSIRTFSVMGDYPRAEEGMISGSAILPGHSIHRHQQWAIR